MPQMILQMLKSLILISMCLTPLLLAPSNNLTSSLSSCYSRPTGKLCWKHRATSLKSILQRTAMTLKSQRLSLIFGKQSVSSETFPTTMSARTTKSRRSNSWWSRLLGRASIEASIIRLQSMPMNQSSWKRLKNSSNKDSRVRICTSSTRRL